MTIVRVQHSLQGASNLPEDMYVNTFYFIGPRPDQATGIPLAAAVRDFYTGQSNPAVPKVQNWLGQLSDATGAKIKMYDMIDTLPRQPLFIGTGASGTFGPGGSNQSLPEELAVCLSYRGDMTSGAPNAPARRRGRIYVGPLSLTALAHDVTGAPRVPSAMQDSLVLAANLMASGAQAAGWNWAVFSATQNIATPITDIYVDNAFDVQRRRGSKPTGRVNMVVP